MSQLIRQLNIIASLKSGSDGDKMMPFYKAIAPVLSYDPSIRFMHTQVLNKNFKLKTPENRPENPKEKRNLAIILSWLLAKTKHIDSYVKLYMSRGFDVLTVDINPKQMLFPVTGTQVIAKNILDYVETNKQYDKVLIHAFSIGGYLMGEVFTKLDESGGKYADFTDRVIGLVLDSGVDVEGIPTGFPRALSNNPITIKAMQWYVQTHLAFMYNVATKHYLRASQNFHNTPLKCPALMLVSESDQVGTPVSNRRVANSWRAKGVEVSIKCWEKSPHVSHMHFHKEEYVAEIDNFLSKLNLNSA